MFVFATFLYFAFSTCYARPNDIVPQNVVTVPPNCPDGQEYVNGACRDIWRNDAVPSNVVTVPPNCPDGQEYVNGQCRDIWFKTQNEQSNNSNDAEIHNVISVPTNCPSGQQWVNGQCRDIWRSSKYDDAVVQNVVSVPNNCPSGQQWVNGQCRDIWRSGTSIKNVVTVPSNCPAGQQYINGQCREVWRRSPIETFIANLKNQLLEQQYQIDEASVNIIEDIPSNKNIISVPNQCPIGYRPDALGICRPIMDYLSTYYEN